MAKKLKKEIEKVQEVKKLKRFFVRVKGQKPVSFEAENLKEAYQKLNINN